MHNKDISIATQVAFNTTVSLFNPADLLGDEGQTAFVGAFDVLSDALFSQIAANTEKYADPEPEKTVITVPQAQAAVEAAFAGTTDVSGEFSLEVVDKQGDIPAWLVEACQKAGVTKVFDNRGSRDPAKNQPYFRQAGGDKKGFWPPKDRN